MNSLLPKSHDKLVQSQTQRFLMDYKFTYSRGSLTFFNITRQVLENSKDIIYLDNIYLS